MDPPSYEEARLTAGCANLGSVAAYFDIIHFLDIAREQTQHLERVKAMFTATECDLANLVALTRRSQRALGNVALEELRRAKALRDALEGSRCDAALMCEGLSCCYRSARGGEVVHAKEGCVGNSCRLLEVFG